MINLVKEMKFCLVITAVCILTPSLCFGAEVYDENGLNRLKCETSSQLSSLDKESIDERLAALRNRMQSENIEAYIVTSYNDHQSELKDESESPLKFISGFSVTSGEAAVTRNSSALWIEAKYFKLADYEMSCDWKIFSKTDNKTIATWLQNELPAKSIVGADSKTVPHELWLEWIHELDGHILKQTTNLIEQPTFSPDYLIMSHNSTFSGILWHEKVKILREELLKHRCSATVISSLTEIAYLLNLRSSNFEFVPVFRAYLIVSQDEIFLYTNRTKVSLGPQLQLKYDFKFNKCLSNNCVVIKEYSDFWNDLKSFQRKWQNILLPTMNSFDMGTSEAIYSALHQTSIVSRASPVVQMRSQKNKVERVGMRHAHVKDAVATCESFRILEEKFGDVEFAPNLTEYFLNSVLISTRENQDRHKGFSFKPSVSFGENSGNPFYYPEEDSAKEITKKKLLIVDFGTQYLDGTTRMSRTIHFGKPTREQKRIYTTILAGLIRLSLHVFPEQMLVSGIDVLIREPMWKRKEKYEVLGSGIGSYLDAEEAPINIAQPSEENLVFKDGNFFFVSLSHIRPNDFGIKLTNVFEVVDTGKENFSGSKFLKFRPATLVPFDIRLIELAFLTAQERMWLNEYNANIREIVGDELKKQNKMDTFYWMMNQTEYIPQYLTEKEYLKSASSCLEMKVLFISLIVGLLFVVRNH